MYHDKIASVLYNVAGHPVAMEKLFHLSFRAETEEHSFNAKRMVEIAHKILHEVPRVEENVRNTLLFLDEALYYPALVQAFDELSGMETLVELSKVCVYQLPGKEREGNDTRPYSERELEEIDIENEEIQTSGVRKELFKVLLHYFQVSLQVELSPKKRIAETLYLRPTEGELCALMKTVYESIHAKNRPPDQLRYINDLLAFICN